MLGALTFGLKVAMSYLPNIEPVSLLVMVFAVVFGKKCLYPIYLYVLMEILLYGIGTWNMNYLYVWAILALGAYLMRKLEHPLYWALLSGGFGLAFGLLCAIPYFFVGLIGGGISQGLTQMFAWWVAGIPFDLIHGVSNFVIMLALYRPIGSLLKKMPQIIAR